MGWIEHGSQIADHPMVSIDDDPIASSPRSQIDNGLCWPLV
jgi:hypothetical protein